MGGKSSAIPSSQRPSSTGCRVMPWWSGSKGQVTASEDTRILSPNTSEQTRRLPHHRRQKNAGGRKRRKITTRKSGPSPDPETGENYFGTSGDFYFGIDTCRTGWRRRSSWRLSRSESISEAHHARARRSSIVVMTRSVCGTCRPLRRSPVQLRLSRVIWPVLHGGPCRLSRQTPLPAIRLR